jgi:hypothetical protein
MIKYKCYWNVATQIAIELHNILNLLLQQCVPDTIFTRETYILRSGFEVNSTCGTCTYHKAADVIRIIIFLMFQKKSKHMGL